MSYVKITNYEAKDALATGDPNKKIRGTELDNEFDSLETEDALNVKKSTLQAQTYIAFTTSGTAPSFTATPSPALSAYTANQRFRIKFHAAGAGSDTLNLNGLGAKSLKQYDGAGAKVAAIITINMLTDVEYDGTDMLIMDPTISPTINGGTAANDDITIQGTTHATRTTSYVLLQPNGGNVGVGTTTPAGLFTLNSATHALPATSGATQSDGLRQRFTVGGGTGVLDFGIKNVDSGWIQSTDSSNLATNYYLLLNPNGGNVGIGTTGPSSKLDVTTTSLGTTQTTSSGLALVNTTAAALDAQQISPALRWSGYGWKTNATAASQAVDFRSYVVPVQGAANPTGYLSFESSINGGAYGNLMVVTSAGNVGIGTTAPSSKLHVYQTDPSTGGAIARIQGVGDQGEEAGLTYYAPYGTDSTNRAGRIYTAFDAASFTGARLTLQSITSGDVLVDTLSLKNGNVGIGTTTPPARFAVKAAGTDAGALETVATFYKSSAAGGAITIRTSDSVANVIATWVTSGVNMDLSLTPTKSDGTQNEAMRVKATDGNIDIINDLAINGGDLTSSATTFNLLNATVTTLNIGGAATAVSIGAATGTLTVNNATLAAKNITVGSGTAIAKYLSTTLSLDFASIAANTTAALDVALTGVAAGDTVIVSPSGVPEAGLVWSGLAGTDLVTVRLGNVTTAAIDPAARTWRVSVIKH